MTGTRQAEQVRGALGGIVIALATLIAIFAFYALARAQTPSANIEGATGATTVNNGASSVIGASTTVPTNGSSDMNAGAATSTTSDANASTTATSTSTGSGAAGTEPSGSGAAGGNAPLLVAPPASAPAPMVVSISRDGNVLIRGVVVDVSGSSITLASWGGNWTITTNANTQVIPGTLAGMQIGDFVGAAGVIGTSAFTVNASVVRDWTMAPALGGTAGSSTAPAASSTGAGGTASTSLETNTGGATY